MLAEKANKFLVNGLITVMDDTRFCPMLSPTNNANWPAAGYTGSVLLPCVSETVIKYTEVNHLKMGKGHGIWSWDFGHLSSNSSSPDASRILTHSEMAKRITNCRGNKAPQLHKRQNVHSSQDLITENYSLIAENIPLSFKYERLGLIQPWCEAAYLCQGWICSVGSKASSQNDPESMHISLYSFTRYHILSSFLFCYPAQNGENKHGSPWTTIHLSN